MALYFGVAALIAALIIYFYTRCVRSTALVIACSLVAVVWQLGLVALLGFELDPYSILVPFLVFAIGVSHGAQKMNGIMQDIGRGAHRLVAARFTFRRLFLAGLTALLADAVGFAVLMVIDIPVIQDLALTASVGVAVLILTNLILLPVFLSYVGVSPAAAAAQPARGQRRAASGQGFNKLWHVARALHRAPLGASARWPSRRALTVGGFVVSTHLKIGDLDPGAPGAASRLALQPRQRLHHGQLLAVERPVRGDRQDGEGRLPEVRDAGRGRPARVVAAAGAGGADHGVACQRGAADHRRQQRGQPEVADDRAQPGRAELRRAAGERQQPGPVQHRVLGDAGDRLPVRPPRRDARPRGRRRPASSPTAHSTDERKFLLAAGSAGIDAATNIVVRKAWVQMLLLVYAAVIVLCFITFRSWRAVVVAVVPLVITSILCEALMVWLGIGVKVATLPVIALGVGIGVDYALYLLSVQLAQQRLGVSLAEAYRRTLQFTGKVVVLVGVTLAAGVITWALSPIKFQADMGILLAFMFIWNMIGAVVLIPALSHFLLPSTAARGERARRIGAAAA